MGIIILTAGIIIEAIITITKKKNETFEIMTDDIMGTQVDYHLDVNNIQNEDDNSLIENEDDEDGEDEDDGDGGSGGGGDGSGNGGSGTNIQRDNNNNNS